MTKICSQFPALSCRLPSDHILHDRGYFKHQQPSMVIIIISISYVSSPDYIASTVSSIKNL